MHSSASSHRLRIGRFSQAGACYFLTFCTAQRKNGLADVDIWREFLEQLEKLPRDGIAQPRATVLMPDHLHLIFNLGEKLILPKVVARLKGKLAPMLRTKQIQWQPGYHDHRLRPEEPIEPYFRYLHLNPYVAGLCLQQNIWPYTWFDPADWAWFQGCTVDGEALPQWLDRLP